MAKTVCRYIYERLWAYQEITGKTCTEMALDFGVTLSNLYLYRSGRGNPRANTVDRIVSAVEAYCPEALEKVGR